MGADSGSYGSSGCVTLAGFFELAQMLLPQRQLSTVDFLTGATFGGELDVSVANLIRTLVGRPLAMRW